MLIGYRFSYIKEKNNPLPPPLQMESKNRFFWINFLCNKFCILSSVTEVQPPRVESLSLDTLPKLRYCIQSYESRLRLTVSGSESSQKLDTDSTFQKKNVSWTGKNNQIHPYLNSEHIFFVLYNSFFLEPDIFYVFSACTSF